MHHQGENAGRQDYKEMERVNTTMLEEGRIQIHAPWSDPGTTHVHNVKFPTRYHAINMVFESTQIEISDALNDALVQEHVTMNNLGPIVLACPDACVMQECSLCAVHKPV